MSARSTPADTQTGNADNGVGSTNVSVLNGAGGNTGNTGSAVRPTRRWFRQFGR